MEDLLLGAEVVVEEAVRDTRLVGDVPHPGLVVAALREDLRRSVEQQPTLVDGSGCHSARSVVGCGYTGRSSGAFV